MLVSPIPSIEQAGFSLLVWHVTALNVALCGGHKLPKSCLVVGVNNHFVVGAFLSASTEYKVWTGQAILSEVTTLVSSTRCTIQSLTQ